MPLDDPSQIHFCIICPAWNCEAWVEKSLTSLQTQLHDNFHCVLIDDVSDDNTWERAKQVVADDERFTVMRNDIRRFPLANIVTGTNHIAGSPNDVIVILDADDWLPNPHVLSRLAKLYIDPDLWLTYGSCELVKPPSKMARFRKWLYGKPSLGQAKPYPPLIRERNWYRHHPGSFLATHLRSYRQFLWSSIRDEDLRDENNEYFKAAADVATMWPMLEMSTEKHYRFLPDVLYVYNNEHGHSEHKQEKAWHESPQYMTNVTLRSMPPYSPLTRH